MEFIYLDNAATTPISKEVIDAMMPYFETQWFNPSSRYPAALEVRKMIEESRAIIAKSINAEPEEIYFTSGGSEANCWALQGFAKSHQHPVIITSDIEHHSILECAKHMSYSTVANDTDGKILIPSLERNLYILQNRDVLVSIQMANNEIGTIQDIKLITDICHKNGALVHTDAVQAFGQVPIDVKSLGIDMMSISGHKVGAPKGVGCLFIKNGVEIEPIIYGTQENAKRGGTQNCPFFRAFSMSVLAIKQQFHCNIRDHMIKELCETFDGHLNGHPTDRLQNNINITFPHIVSSEAAVYALGENGIACSAGSACNEGNPKPSHVLRAIGLTDEMAQKTLRFTLPHEFTMEEADVALDRIKKSLQLISR